MTSLWVVVACGISVDWGRNEALTFAVSGTLANCSDVKCKAIPLQAWAGREGSRGLRLPNFKTIGT